MRFLKLFEINLSPDAEGHELVFAAQAKGRTLTVELDDERGHYRISDLEGDQVASRVYGVPKHDVFGRVLAILARAAQIDGLHFHVTKDSLGVENHISKHKIVSLLH